MADPEKIKHALSLIFSGIDVLQQASENSRKFTIDGRLVGDIGEVIAGRDYDIVLDGVQRPLADARTPDGRDVQIKATFKDSLTFKAAADFYLGLKLERDGTYREVFNGPGACVADACRHLAGFGTALVSISVTKLEKLSSQIADFDRVPKRPSEIRRD